MLSPIVDELLSVVPFPPPADRAIYVYGFIDAARMHDMPGLPDVDQALCLHRAGAIGALICRIPTSDFKGDEGERNLANPAWLMPRICQHAAVVEDVMAWSPVFPAGFPTLFIDSDSLTNFMKRQEQAITRFLLRVTGQREWALRLTAQPGGVTELDELAAELWPEWTAYSPGKRYLRLRQEQPGLLKVAANRVAQLMPAIVDALRPSTTAVRPLGLSTDPTGQHVESYALLAPVENRSALEDRIDELAAEWEPRRVHIALTGPWPPYSFRPALDNNPPFRSEINL
jgi:Gas vesicle synthesis protein GvpL/GvpF